MAYSYGGWKQSLYGVVDANLELLQPSYIEAEPN
jgi:hypothetical protein